MAFMAARAELGGNEGDWRVKFPSVGRLAELEHLFGADYQERLRKGFAETFAVRNAEIVPQPIHPGSRATYLATFYRGDDLYHASAMGLNETTSDAHFHEWPAGRIPPRTLIGDTQKIGQRDTRVNVAEEYKILTGKAILELEEEGKKYEVTLDEKNSFYVVHSGILHRVRTEDAPALLLLKTRYGALLDPSQLHLRSNKSKIPFDPSRF